MLIPAVFTSIFVMIPKEREILATTLAGLFAMIAPTIGPFVGGYVTQHLSWHWIFLINIPAGLLVSVVVALCVKTGEADFKVLRHLDYATLILAAIFLGSLQLLLNEAPSRHWHGSFVTITAVTCILAAIAGAWRALTHASPFVDLRRFQRRDFALGSFLSFILGAGLYGSSYLLALFLGLVRGHTPMVIGEIMVVSGAAQLLMAPVAAWAELKVDGRVLIAAGFLLFGAGLFANGLENPRSEFWGLFWPQILRGSAVMLCILPATRLALEGWAQNDVADASALFNLMRNLGGAIGIALIDTLVATRTEDHAAAIGARLQAGDAGMARLVGLPTATFQGHDMGPVDPITRAMVAPLVERTALTQSFNEAWFLLAGLFVLALLSVPLLRASKR
jgi:DHA2 family multidrug resistance protein